VLGKICPRKEDMSTSVNSIASRHIARCLSRITEVHHLPELCQDVIKREMRYCAEDVSELLTQGDQSNDDTRDIDGNH
jgi:hypothetical protein